jgi:hypothetical protein
MDSHHHSVARLLRAIQAQLTACLGRTVGYGLRESFSESEHALFVHFLLLVVAFLMSGAAVLAPASVSNPTTAENFLPID